MSTGLFPQEFIISFASMMNITNIKIKSANGRIFHQTKLFCSFVCPQQCQACKSPYSMLFASAIFLTVRELLVERSVQAEPLDFEQVSEKGT